MLLTPSIISTDYFTYDAGSRIFAADASDLGPSFRPGRLYDDACDLGITLRSARTGRDIRFYLATTHRDSEGDVMYTEFLIAPYQGAAVEALNLRIHIFND